ncbi:hypothetical protein LBMAG53_24090 [Planctomycetota bacterium]|nr:hypothetical protein LBMAG53_24090 [Planctomycetota bacterium]
MKNLFLASVCLAAGAGLAAGDAPPPATATALPATRLVTPSEPFSVARFTTTCPPHGPVEVLVQFRGPRPVNWFVIAADKGFISPHDNGIFGPGYATWDLHDVRLEGGRIAGPVRHHVFSRWNARGKPEDRLKAAQGPDVRGPVLTADLVATVASGMLTGTFGGQDLAGTWKDAAALTAEQVLAPGKDWRQLSGNDGCWRGSDAGRPVVADPTREARLVWMSEEAIPADRESRTDPVLGTSGAWSPILGDGRLYYLINQPAGEVVDAKEAQRLKNELDDYRLHYHLDWDPAARSYLEQGIEAAKGRIDGHDVVVCVDAASGRTLWKHVLSNRGRSVVGYNKHEDQGRTACYADGKLFIMGRLGRLYCLDGASGALDWEVPTAPAWEVEKAKELATATMHGWPPGAPNFPSLYAIGPVVLMHHVGIAFDRNTGAVRWSFDQGWASPIKPGAGIAGLRLEGKDHVLSYTGGVLAKEEKDTVTLREADTGTIVWTQVVDGFVRNCGFTRLYGDRLLTVTTTGVIRCWLLGRGGAAKAWELASPDPKVGCARDMQANAAADGVLYLRWDTPGSGQTAQILQAVDLASGKVLAQVGGSGTFIGATTVADGFVFHQWDGCHATTVLDVFKVRTLEKVGTWSQPHKQVSAYDIPQAWLHADGRVFFRGCRHLWCYDLRRP